MATKKKAKRAQKTAERKKKKSKSGAFNPDFSLLSPIESLPPRMNMERAMSEMFGKRGSGPVSKAQEIIYAAWDCGDPNERIEMAFEALMVSRECADAYVLLAEEAAETPGEMTAYFMLGIAAGERALGERAFAEGTGQFWGMLETRPYMRALAGMAECMRASGALEAAAENFREMLYLNPNDNQGVRFPLAAVLLEMGEEEATEKLIGEYKEEISTDWHYSRALLSFRKKGDSGASRGLLQKAVESNGHVPLYLLNQKNMPKEFPEYHGFGDENEAINFVVNFEDCWKMTPGALEWLKNETRG